MVENGHATDWGDVDDAADVDSVRTYLDAVEAVDDVQTLKRGSYRLLAPETGDTLVDVGCGTGADVRALAESVAPTGQVLGVDASSELLATARQRAAAATECDSGPAVETAFVAGDANRLPLPNARVEGTRADRVLQHLDRPRAAFDELVRVTAPGGRVVVTDADWGTLTLDAPRTTTPGLMERLADPRWGCATNPRLGRRLRRWAVSSGLTGVDAEATTLVFDDYETADEVLGLTGRVDRAANADTFDAESWYRLADALRAADDEDRFTASLTLFTVAGTVPTEEG